MIHLILIFLIFAFYLQDLIIFPDEAEFRKVTQCHSGRVFVLRFKNTPRRYFYWMQEPKDDKDEEFCNKINEYINNPPAPGSSRGGGSGGLSPGAGLDLNSVQDSDLQGLLNNITPQQLMSVLGGGMGGAASLASLLNAATRSPASTPAPASTPSTTPAVSVTTTTASTAETKTSTTTTAATPQIQLSDLQNIISGLQVPSPDLNGKFFSL